MTEPFVNEPVEKPDFEIHFDPRMTKEEIERVTQALSDFWLACGGSSPLRVEFRRETVTSRQLQQEQCRHLRWDDTAESRRKCAACGLEKERGA